MRPPVILAILWTLVIMAACLLPGADIPDISLFEFDKLAHFFMFAVLGWVWMYALLSPLRRRIVTILAGGIAYAFLTEVYQGFLPFDRQPDILDALANTGGLVLSVALFWFLSAIKQN